MKKILIITVLFFGLSGCASYVSGDSKRINILTNNGEEVIATITSSDGTEKTKLPARLNFTRSKENITIVVPNDSCYNQSTAVVSSNLNGWFFGNFLTGGTGGSITDYLSNSMWTYDDTITVNVDEKSNCKK